jgi:uncharacterized protein (TIGR03437 family)
MLPAQTNPFTVRPVLGSGSHGDGGPAAAALLDGPYGLARDQAGNLYISESNAGVIRRVRPDGVIERVAGNGVIADGAEGQPALSTALVLPTALLVNREGNLIFADGGACRIRLLAADGSIRNLVGTGRCPGATAGFPGGGGSSASPKPALETDIGSIGGMVIDGDNRLVFSDETSHVVRRLDADGMVRTIAGVGQAGFSGDDIPATSSALRSPRGLALDRDGNLYIADGENCRLRRVNTAGEISTILGTGTCATAGATYDGSSLGRVTGVAYRSDINAVVIASPGLARVLQLNLDATRGTTILGNGRRGASESTSALAYNVDEPRAVIATGDRVLVADLTAFRVLQVQGGSVSAVAGIWPQLDTYPSALSAPLLRPKGLCLDNQGALIAVDAGAERVLSFREPERPVAVAGARYPSGHTAGDDGPALSAQIDTPRRVACASNGEIYLTQGNRIRAINARGIIRAVMSAVRIGNTTSTLSEPAGLAIDSQGRIVFSEAGAHRVVRYDPAAGSATLIAGTGVAGFRGDGAAAVDARLNSPGDLAFDSQGNLLIADRGNGRVRRVSPDGVIQTIAGSSRGFSYTDISGELATSIGLGSIDGMAVDARDNIYISEPLRVDVIGVDGRIQVVVGLLAEDGNGARSYRGQALKGADGLAVAANGRVYISDSRDGRVLVAQPATDTGPAPSIAPSGVLTATAFGGAAAVAPGSWVEIYGQNLANGSRSWAAMDFEGTRAPTTLDGTRVTIGGQAAFVSYISPGQVNIQAPSPLAAGSQEVRVTTAAGISEAYFVTVTARQPALLAPATFISAGRQYAAALLSDGTTFVLPRNALAGIVSRPARAGETIVLYGVGFGATSPGTNAGEIASAANSLTAPLRFQFGNTPAAASYAGLAPGFVGLYQFNVTVPSGVTGDAVPLTFTLDGSAGSQTLYTAISE